MAKEFDPYVDWLGISPAEGPANYYSLLGVKRFESDLEKIIAAADERMEVLRRYQNGSRAKASQQMLNEVSNARVCLLDAARRRQYDEKLSQRIDINSLPNLPMPVQLFPAAGAPSQANQLPDVEQIRTASNLMPRPTKKRSVLVEIPSLSIWVYVTVIGMLSVFVMFILLILRLLTLGD